MPPVELVFALVVNPLFDHDRAHAVTTQRRFALFLCRAVVCGRSKDDLFVFVAHFAQSQPTEWPALIVAACPEWHGTTVTCGTSKNKIAAKAGIPTPTIVVALKIFRNPKNEKTNPRITKKDI